MQLAELRIHHEYFYELHIHVGYGESAEIELATIV